MADTLSPPATSPSPSSCHALAPPDPHSSSDRAAAAMPGPSPSSPSSSSPPTSSRPIPREARSQQQQHPSRERIPSYAQNRLSAFSARSASSRSRPHSHASTTSTYAQLHPSYSSSSSAAATPGAASPYAFFVRDFAYPAYHPMHFGPPADAGSSSGATTPGSDWNPGRRASDSAEMLLNGAGSSGGGAGGPTWTAGPWGGDGGALYGGESSGVRDPGEEMESLPSTSFGASGTADGNFNGVEFSATGVRYGKGGSRHRKSKSHASISDFERGRRRESGGGGGGGSGAWGYGDRADMFYFSGGAHAAQGNGAAPHAQFSDPAGRESLRQSRGYYGAAGSGAENGGAGRRDSRYNDTTLPSRRFHSSGSVPTPATSVPASTAAQPLDPDSDLPLDAEYSTQHSPQRESLGPEDEELFAGPSLALYNFEPENPNELRLVEGQTILVSYRHGQGWLVAEDPQTGEQGLVPEEYVRLLRDIEGWDPERGGFIEDDDEDDEGEGEEDGDEDDSLAMDATLQMENDDPLIGLSQHAERMRVKGEQARSGVDSPVEAADAR